MAFKMKGFSPFTKMDGKKKKKNKRMTIHGEETGEVNVNKKGEKFAIFDEYLGKNPPMEKGDTIVASSKSLYKDEDGEWIMGTHKVKKVGEKKWKITGKYKPKKK